ncbi:MAG TPA: GGDEF domain-containing protein [Deltaproteobacteria bacterium]|nr:GGDEF domain-containing protein [Deltaproteobacteria bacterium]
MISDEIDQARLLEELERLEREILGRCGKGTDDSLSRGLLLARVIPDMTEDEWYEGTGPAAFENSWMAFPLNGNKVEALAKLNEKLEKLAHAGDRDYLSGLYNRRFFLRVLKREMTKTEKYCMPLALAIADIDNFKEINDTCGHVAGDEVVRRVADVFSSGIRAGDYAARIGGDEFALILPAAGAAESGTVVKRFLERVRDIDKQIGKDCRLLRCTLSLGVAVYTGFPLMTPEQLIACADKELYAVKRNGKDGFRVTPVDDAGAAEPVVRRDEKHFLARG